MLNNLKQLQKLLHDDICSAKGLRIGIYMLCMHMDVDPHKTYHCHDHMLTLAGWLCCIWMSNEHMNLAD